MELGCVILAGGRSSRMGKDKAFLPWAGRTFIAHMITKARAYGFDDIVVVTNDQEAFQGVGAEVIGDIHARLGPLSGIHAGLSRRRHMYSFVVSCDMPLLDFSVVDQLLPYADGGYMAVVPSVEEKRQPLAALYHQDCGEVIADMLLTQDERRVGRLLERIKTKFVEQDELLDAFFNVNTPNDLVMARAKAVNASRRIPIVSVAADKSGTGKTTFLEAVIPRLKEKGLRVAVVKSDGHDFSMDHEGKDTWRFTEAGADAVAIVSPYKYAIIQRTAAKQSLEAVAGKITDVDLILIESRSHGVFPIIAVMREGFCETTNAAAEDLAAIVTDKADLTAAVPVLPLGDPEPAAAYIVELMGR